MGWPHGITVFGLGATIVTTFVRWRFPKIPHYLSSLGIGTGVGFLAVSFIPGQLSVATILAVVCCALVALALEWKLAKPGVNGDASSSVSKRGTNGNDVAKFFFGTCMGMAVIALIIAAVVGVGIGTKPPTSTPTKQADPEPKGVVMVNEPGKCPKGWSIISSSVFDHNGTGVSAPIDAHLCIVNDTFKENRTGVDLRPPGH